MNAAEALAAYRNTGSETAFSGLVRHYSNLVYSIAKRRVNHGPLAEEVTQAVFTRLAKSPPAIRSDGELSAWLHRTTTHVAIDTWRAETRRRAREQLASLMQVPSESESHVWDEISPHLDQALDELNDADRQAVLLRFFERKPMRDVGQALGVSEDAAKMRVSRAIERLRQQLLARGITCTAVLLAPALTARAVEAAPAQLLVRLAAIKLAAPVAGGVAGISVQLIKSKAALATVVAVLSFTVLVALSPRNNKKSITSPAPEPTALETTRPELASEPNLPASSAAATSFAIETDLDTRFVLRVVDRETGQGLGGAQVRAAYFYAGGVGERHDLRSTGQGDVLVPYQNDRTRKAGLNLFVAVPGYVPKAINVHNRREQEGAWENFVMELDPAVTVVGVVVNEDGFPVEGVTLEAHRLEDHKSGEPNTDFQTTKVITDESGRFLFPYVPKTYEKIEFSLTCDDYAVTRVAIPVGRNGTADALIVIERGYSVVGRVIDSDGNPMAGVNVREKHEYGHRKLSNVTDAEGRFALNGLGVPSSDMTLRFPRQLEPGERLDPATLPKTKSLGRADQVAEVTIEAEGMAAQCKTVQLTQRTNVLNIVLAPSRVFRGRVVDEFGKPIPNAVVRTDSHFNPYVPNKFDWLTHTDADGRFEWRSAPDEETCFWFEADNYEIIRGRPMIPNGTEYQVVLKAI